MAYNGLIDRNKLLEVMDAHANKLAGMKVDTANHYSIDTLDVIKLSGYEEAIDHVEAAPAVDAEPVRHGRFDKRYKRPCSTQFTCSKCGGVAYDAQKRRDAPQVCSYKYCQHCGAKMDEKEETDDA